MTKTPTPPPKEKPRYVLPWFHRTPGWLAFDVLTFLATPLYIACLAGPTRRVWAPIIGDDPLWVVAVVFGVALYLAREVVYQVAEWRDVRRLVPVRSK